MLIGYETLYVLNTCDDTRGQVQDLIPHWVLVSESSLRDSTSNSLDTT